MKTASHRLSVAGKELTILLLTLLLLFCRASGSAEETMLPAEPDAAVTEPGESPEDRPAEQAEPEDPDPMNEEDPADRERGEDPEDTDTAPQETPSEALPEPVPEEAQTPAPAQTPTPTPTPKPVPMFDIIDGEIISLSITEKEFIEIAEFLKEELDVNDAVLAGILANLEGESGFDPNKIGDMGGAYGLCQWRGPRLDQMVEYCDENDLNPVSLEGQLHFLAHDLKEVYRYAYNMVRQCDDTESGAVEATYLFCAYYEVPSDPEEESKDREELAKLLIYPKLNELSAAE